MPAACHSVSSARCVPLLSPREAKGAFVPAHFVAPWIGGTALAALMIALFAGYAWNWRKERGGWWPPFAIVALVLIFGVKFG